MEKERRSREQHFEDVFLPEIERLASQEIDDDFLALARSRIDSGLSLPEGIMIMLDAEGQGFEALVKQRDKKITKKINIPYKYAYASIGVTAARGLSSGEISLPDFTLNDVKTFLRFRGTEVKELVQNETDQFEARMTGLITADPSGVSVVDYLAYDPHVREIRSLGYGSRINNKLIQIGAERYKKYVSALADPTLSSF